MKLGRNIRSGPTISKRLGGHSFQTLQKCWAKLSWMLKSLEWPSWRAFLGHDFTTVPQQIAEFKKCGVYPCSNPQHFWQVFWIQLSGFQFAHSMASGRGQEYISQYPIFEIFHQYFEKYLDFFLYLSFCFLYLIFCFLYLTFCFLYLTFCFLYLTFCFLYLTFCFLYLSFGFLYLSFF